MTDCQMERFALETLKLTARYIEGHRAEYDQWLAEREKRSGRAKDQEGGTAT